MKYKKIVLFIYDEFSSEFIDILKNNDFDSEVIAVEKEQFLADPLEYIVQTNHLVLSGDMQLIAQLLKFAYAQGVNGQHCTLGFLPLESQKVLRNSYRLSKDLEDNIEIALRDDSKAINLLECNGQLVLFKVVVGQIPLLQGWNATSTPIAFLKNIVLGLKDFFNLSLDKISIETKNGKQLKTVASGFFVVNQNHGSRLSQVLLNRSSMRADKLSLIILSPFSAVEYFLFLFSLIFHFNRENNLPHAVSNIKSEEIIIATESSASTMDIKLDESGHTTFPLHFKIIKNAIKINAADEFWQENAVSVNNKEVIRIHNLPDEKEISRYYKKQLPFFSVASEERFKELFLQLRLDANINSLYIMLMLLSTLLASLGLFSNSAAVVIGAMLLAPLMSPIISFSMGLLRDDKHMIISSLLKISLGFVLAILASSILTLLLPQFELSNEIKARIHPNLIDLGVAIFSGVAAAYTKAHKELLSSLAGVAIAVALVPPLAVAGIGLGRADLYVFEGALLLFMTNLIGITLAAIISFKFLGFSNAVKSKKNLFLIVLVLLCLSYPLYHTYSESLQLYRLAISLQDKKIVIDNKPVLIERAAIEYVNNRRVINITIALKKSLNNAEMGLLKKYIKQLFFSQYEIRITMKYIL